MAQVNYKWEALIDALREPARLLVLALLSWLITEIIPQLDEAWAFPLLVGLRYADAYLHEYGKATKNDVLVTGITRF